MNENINIERGLLSIIIMEDGEKSGKWLQRLDRRDFALPFHQHLFGVMASLHSQEKPVTEDLVRPYVDDMEFLDVLSANPISTPDKYIDELKVLRKHREWSMALAKASQMDTDEAMQFLTSVKDDVATYEKPLFNLLPLSEAVGTDTEWVGTNWLPIPKRAVTLLTAQGGTGKSFVALQVLLRYLKDNPTKKAFAWLSEDPIGVTINRALAICSAFDIPQRVMDRLFVVGSETEVKHLYTTDGVTSSFDGMKQLLKDIEFVVIDPLIAFYGEAENDNSHARAFMNAFTAWVNKEDKAVLMIHHSTKSDITQGARGAGAFVDAARLTYSLTRKNGEEDAKNKHLFVTIGKDNYNAKEYTEAVTFQRKVFPFELSLTDNSASKNEGIEING